MLICISQQSDIRLSEVADLVGIRERSVHRIVRELSESGYLSVAKVGRNNVYQVNLDLSLRHPLESAHSIRAIVTPLIKKARS